MEYTGTYVHGDVLSTLSCADHTKSKGGATSVYKSSKDVTTRTDDELVDPAIKERHSDKRAREKRERYANLTSDERAVKRKIALDNKIRRKQAKLQLQCGKANKTDVSVKDASVQAPAMANVARSDTVVTSPVAIPSACDSAASRANPQNDTEQTEVLQLDSLPDDDQMPMDDDAEEQRAMTPANQRSNEHTVRPSARGRGDGESPEFSGAMDASGNSDIVAQVSPDRSENSRHAPSGRDEIDSKSSASITPGRRRELNTVTPPKNDDSGRTKQSLPEIRNGVGLSTDGNRPGRVNAQAVEPDNLGNSQFETGTMRDATDDGDVRCFESAEGLCIMKKGPIPPSEIGCLSHEILPAGGENNGEPLAATEDPTPPTKMTETGTVEIQKFGIATQAILLVGAIAVIMYKWGYMYNLFSN